MEVIFLLSFFTIMVHLIIHLGEKAILASPVQDHWMYPIERYLEDVDIETRFNLPRRNDDDNEINASSESTILSNLFPESSKPVGAIKTLSTPPLEIVQAHQYVLTNCEIVDAFQE
ncbi:hypothetical protein HAX54_030560 [Datura stramonium]|uniref:DUF4218 domain-containing protein n=1 Tax=Datura stramonium TaxID=4076 RepID=A0ABS8SB34_DATST|nr:hypothetical protein [Datura stramonium]